MSEKAWLIDTEPSTRFPVFTRLNAADVMADPITPLGASMCWIPNVLPGEYRHDTALEPARALLTGDERPTAVFAANDLSAVAVIEVARSLRLTVPDDLSVVGFDNVPESALCTPPLSTVDQPIRMMGKRAIELLVALIRGEQPESRHVTLETSLVVRQSARALSDGRTSS